MQISNFDLPPNQIICPYIFGYDACTSSIGPEEYTVVDVRCPKIADRMTQTTVELLE